MKSNAPWSVKGIERDARETAKEAARREGMTVGEWLNRVIYTAGDPETSNGEIEGLKISDLVTAIEHLNKKVISAESRGAAALDDLSRNFGGVVERIQRLERVRPGEAGPDIDARLERLETKNDGRQRIDALRALEKAVSQVALQYDAAHKQTAARMETAEKQLQQLASRLDLAGAGAETGESPVAAIGHLKDTIDGMSARIARAEKIAAEASKLRDEAAGSADAEFVERTGARLRILGDEIKRGGDQMRSLEASIKKLSDQIDAAERRSSEGVAKVAETIAELKAQFGRSEGEAERGATTGGEKAEARIAELRRSFNTMIARFGPSGEEAADTEETAGDSGDAGEQAEAVEESPAEFLLEPEDEVVDEDDADAFSFDLDEEPPSDSDEDDAERDALDEIERETVSEKSSEPPQEALDAVLAEFDTISAPARERESEAAADAEAADGAVQKALACESPADYLKKARLAAREAAERAAAEGPTRRRLTPKQRAILAAKIRRKRLSEREIPPVQETDHAGSKEPFVETGADEPALESGPTFASKAAGAISGFKSRFYGPASDQARHQDEEEDASPPAAAKGMLARLKASPLTAALAVAVILAVAALFFLIKDLLFMGAEPVPRTPAATSSPTQTKSTSAEPAGAPAADTENTGAVKPRTLYLDSVAELKNAKTNTETSAAIAGIEQAAELGWPPAQLQLGELYKLGQGLPQDLSKARLWYERAANGGNVLAMHRIGVMEARGQGGARDESGAVVWFEKASNYGLVDSQYNLGALYHPGGDNSRSGVQDAAKAYYWYSIAARNGDQQAGALAASLAPSLSPEKLKEIDAGVASWKAKTPDAEANEVAPAS